MKRRSVLKAGSMAVASTPAIFGGVALPRAAQAQLCRPEGIRTLQSEPNSPPVRHYLEPLYIPPAMADIGEAALSPPPDPSKHQRYDEFPSVHFAQQVMTEGLW